MKLFDIVIIGAGPAGLACAIEAQKNALSYIVLEKGGITDAIRRFPVNMTFFSTPDLLELDTIPFTSPHVRPSRAEALEYYRRVVEHRALNLSLHTSVINISRSDHFVITTQKGDMYYAHNVIVATGYFDHTNRLNIPGEDLPHVSHYYNEPYAYTGTQVLVIGGRNSAVETALDLYRHGAKVTIVHRQAALGESIKYWIRPDIENRVKKGEIALMLHTIVREILTDKVLLYNEETHQTDSIAADFVFALIGYRPDEQLLRSAGVSLNDDLVPEYDPQTFCTNVHGLYIAGSVACGCKTWNIFIENGRMHAMPIMADILRHRE